MRDIDRLPGMGKEQPALTPNLRDAPRLKDKTKQVEGKERRLVSGLLHDGVVGPHQGFGRYLTSELVLFLLGPRYAAWRWRQFKESGRDGKT